MLSKIFLFIFLLALTYNCSYAIDKFDEVIQKIIILDENQTIKDYGLNKTTLPLIKTKEFNNLISSFIGSHLNADQINKIKQCITFYFQKRGYPFIIVITPEQKIENGTIFFQIYMSRVDDVKIKGNKNFQTKVIQNFVSIKKGEYVDTKKIIQDIYWINKNPFRNASVLFKPGKEKLTTDIDYLIEDRRTFRAYVGADNTGFHTTGRNRLFSGFNWGNVWNMDHILSFQFTISTKFNEYKSVIADYSFPFWHKHMIRAYGGYSWIDPSRAIEDLNQKGRSSQASFRYTMPLKLFKVNYLHDISFGFDYKRTNINLVSKERPLIGSKTLITQLVGEYNAFFEAKKFNMPVEIKAYFFPGDIFADQSKTKFGSIRFLARNRYAYINFYCSPYIYLQNDMRFSVNIQFQFASNNLLPSEQFGLGGYNTIRGYEFREVNKDSGIITSYEFISPAYQVIKKLKNDRIRLISFLDFGFGWDHKKTPEIRDPEYLIGLGAGVRYSIGSNLSLRLDWAFKLHKTDFDNSDIGRAHFGLVGSY